MSNQNRKYYVPVDGRLIEVNKEFYYKYYRPIWRIQDHAQRNGECCCPKSHLWKCDGVCCDCPYRIERHTVSLDTPIGGKNNELTLGDVLIDPSPSPAFNMEKKELLQVLIKEINSLDPESRYIFELMLCHSEREAAIIIGLPRSTFKRRWAKIQSHLQEKLKDYYF